jgi:hypothetical protein
MLLLNETVFVPVRLHGNVQFQFFFATSHMPTWFSFMFIYIAHRRGLAEAEHTVSSVLTQYCIIPEVTVWQGDTCSSPYSRLDTLKQMSKWARKCLCKNVLPTNLFTLNKLQS